MKIALVQDWLTEMGGAEKVFEQLYSIFPSADIYTLVYNKDILNKLNIPESRIKASFIQSLPFASKKYRSYFPLFPLAIESFDLSCYDLVISSSYCVAKGAMTNSNQMHICYCHSPVRYAWDLNQQYLKQSGLNKGIKGFLAQYFLSKLRVWDIISLNRVDQFISNSNYIGKRIKKIYNRDSNTIYPPVNFLDFDLNNEKDNYYFTCSRLVPYKKIDLIVESFNRMPDKKLIVIGMGPDFDKIKKLSKSNITIMGHQPFVILKDFMQRAKAFVFAAEEDFGIVPLEAQACGTPVIAYGKGGCLETVINNKTGIYFYEQTSDSIIDAVNRFEQIENSFNYEKIRNHAEKFSDERFKLEIKNFVIEKYNEYKKNK